MFNLLTLFLLTGAAFSGVGCLNELLRRGGQWVSATLLALTCGGCLGMVAYLSTL